MSSVGTFMGNFAKSQLKPWDGDHGNVLSNFAANTTPYFLYDEYNEKKEDVEAETAANVAAEEASQAAKAKAAADATAAATAAKEAAAKAAADAAEAEAIRRRAKSAYSTSAKGILGAATVTTKTLLGGSNKTTLGG